MPSRASRYATLSRPGGGNGVESGEPTKEPLTVVNLGPVDCCPAIGVTPGVAIAPHKCPRRLPQRYTTPAKVARYFGLTYRTALNWIAAGWLKAHRAHAAHYADDRARVTGRGRWHVYENDLEAFLKRMRVSRRLHGFGQGFWTDPK